MKMTCSRINEERRLETVDDGRLLDHAQGATQYWLDLEGEDLKEIEERLASFNLDPEFLEDCLEPGRQRVSVSKGSVFLSFPTCLGDQQHPQYIRILSLPNLVITIHDAPVPGLERMRTDLSAHAQLHAATGAALLFEMLEELFKQHVLLTFEARNLLNELTTLMDESPDAVDLGDVLSLKHQISRLEITFEDQLYCISAVQQIDAEGLQLGEQREDFRDFGHELEYALRAINRLERRLQDLHQFFVANIQEKTNRRINVLTIVQAIFLPLTLLAGIYGMNFQFMPELNWRYAYPAFMGFMGLIVVGELLLFYKIGWFDFIGGQSSSRGSAARSR